MHKFLFRRVPTKCNNEVHPKFLTFLPIVPSSQKHPYYESPNFPEHLDPRTGEPKYDSYISCFAEESTLKVEK